MATLTVNERAVKLVRLDQSIAPGRSASALDAGQPVSLDAAGEYAGGGGAEGVCISTVLAANAPVSVLKKGILELGAALDGLAYGAPIYVAPDGTLDDAATSTDGTNTFEHTQIGYVIAGLGEDPPKKLAKIDA